FINSFCPNIFFTYSTVKLIKVPNTSIALVHRLLQLLIFVYIIGYIVIWKKGYQQFQEPHGTSIIKVKGIARENNAFFIATRQTITYNQTQSICPTALADKSFCNDQNKTLCKTDEPTSSTFGFFTGNCVPSKENETIKVCEMNGWCPEELSDSM
ncbi:unnamed protein product, partial [Adineta steineri]